MTPFQFDRTRRRLWVNSRQVDLGELQPVIQQALQQGLLPDSLDAIVFETPDVTLFLRGSNLRQWLTGKGLLHIAHPYLDTMKIR